MEISPAIQIREAIVSHLRGLSSSWTYPVNSEQIRGVLDLSGTPKDSLGITIASADLGDHVGNSNRILVDIQPSIVVFTHLDDDNDGTICDTISSQVLESIRSITYNLDGWTVAWRGNWTVTDVSIDSSYRQTTLQATLPIVRKINQ